MFNIIPGLQEYITRQGTLELSANNRLVMLTKDETDLSGTLQVMQAELSIVTGNPVQIQVDVDAQPGDIVCVITPEIMGHPQGYTIEIDRNIKIKASTSTGIFYGLQTLRQLLLEKPEHLPKCAIRDYPRYKQRGLMLDAGRKYWTMAYLHDLMLNMARVKLNTLHLHFSDWNAFRLQSDQNSGLAAKRSYSKEDIAQLQAWADLYHITLVPEIDLPGHATAITRYDQTLGFTCKSMSEGRWPGGEDGGWTINFVDPTARQWMKDLVSEFIPLFTGPYFHLGTDEVPDGDKISQCPQVVQYAQEHGYAHVGDAFIEWINEMNALIRSFKKQTQIWSWWDRIPHSLAPDKNIVVNSWVGEGASAKYLDAGYPVVHTSETALYLTPGLELFPNHAYLYHDWKLSSHPNLLGYKICAWADKAFDQSDEYFENLLLAPRTVLAERTWKATHPTRSLADFFTLITKVTTT
jgi:N-acetyl-beta-hexosaminidase